MRRRLLGTLAVAALLAGCGGQPETRTLTVLAAASLTESFGVLERRFEADHPGVDVRISFQGSSALAQQIINGAPADVFASADEANMDKVVRAGRAEGTPRIFAGNRLTIVVPAGNPGQVHSLADLARPGLAVVVCAPQVPCGSATRKVTEAARVTLRPRSEEQDVKAVLNKVSTREADAGLVYVSDVRTDEVTAIDFPESRTAINSYPIVVVKGAPQAELAARFVELVRGETGRGELTRAGLTVP